MNLKADAANDRRASEKMAPCKKRSFRHNPMAILTHDAKKMISNNLGRAISGKPSSMHFSLDYLFSSTMPKHKNKTQARFDGPLVRGNQTLKGQALQGSHNKPPPSE